jgi:uncharacterized membrane protein
MDNNFPGKNSLLFKTFRIEALSDGVFAIAMTLLILEIKLPDFSRVHSENDLIWQIMVLGPKIFSYVLSFVVLGIYWVGHHNRFLFIKHSDRTFIWINVFFLLCVSALPFSTALLGDFKQYITTMVIYGSNLILIGLSLLWIWKHAVRKKLIPDEMIDKRINNLVQKMILIPVLCYFIAILCSFIHPNISRIIFLLVQVIYVFSGRFDKKLNDSLHLKN